jgi:hypothetical protein
VRKVEKPTRAVSGCSDIRDKPCRVCGTSDTEKPMVFRGSDFCCEQHRKVGMGEIAPTEREWRSMERPLMEQLNARWGGTDVTR